MQSNKNRFAITAVAALLIAFLDPVYQISSLAGGAFGGVVDGAKRYPSDTDADVVHILRPADRQQACAPYADCRGRVAGVLADRAHL